MSVELTEVIEPGRKISYLYYNTVFHIYQGDVVFTFRSTAPIR
ncbi:hypothetical protein HMPREF1863_00155 [Aedoeadaptatus coxii]|uniref:Uncharacterized protein n=1 Tax=Aedoeadaptatus coxii TaxID=755172 RepID=A0A134AL54_9FIRM|nr:hypothetical protein HMPREF1863_00155 [Peptoniphilus coxii]